MPNITPEDPEWNCAADDDTETQLAVFLATMMCMAVKRGAGA